MKKFTLLTTLILSVITIAAQIIHVPGDNPGISIQEGIDIAVDGDTILVAEGTYFENINFNGKAIVLASQFILDDDTSHIANTIIDGSEPENPDVGSVVTFDSEENITSILCGFTITGGSGSIVTQNNFRVGGGINLINSGASILHNIIDNNNIIHQNFAAGGGIDAMTTSGPASLLILSNNKIINNSVTSAFQADGGGVYVGMNAQIVNNDINGNELLSQGDYSFGGGIRITPAFVPIEVEIQGNRFSNNSAACVSESKGGIGGGFYISSNFSLTASFSGNTIEYNEVKGENSYGAGAFARKVANDFVFENNIIRNNIATEGDCSGGGLCIWWGGGTYQNNVIQNNEATWGGGICAIHNNSDSLAILVNNTVTGNEAAYGGGLYLLEADAVVFNTILWDNESSIEGTEIFELESNLEVRYSNIEGDWLGNGNMDEDPEFQNDSYHLQWSSLLVNEGKSSVLINNEYYDAPEYDIDGDERPFDGTYPDIGADEAQWYYTGIDEPTKNQTSVLNIYPNPSTDITTIKFELQSISKTNITIYNHLGEEVDMILDDNLPKGNHNFEWNAEDLTAGIYYCVLRTKNQTQTVKIIRF